MRLAPQVRAGNPDPPVLSCTAWGFSCPRACVRGGGLLPRLFTLTLRLAPTGGLFSVTLSVDGSFRPRPPRVLRGMLPFGVRTFLSPPALRPTKNGRPPTALIPTRPDPRTQARKRNGRRRGRRCRTCLSFRSAASGGGGGGGDQRVGSRRARTENSWRSLAMCPPGRCPRHWLPG